jgi:hypothetical protein
MTAKAFTTISGEPGTTGTSRSFRSRPPIQGEAAWLDIEPFGHRDVDASPRGEGRSASQEAKGDLDLETPNFRLARYLWQPLMIATAFVFP